MSELDDKVGMKAWKILELFLISFEEVNDAINSGGGGGGGNTSSSNNNNNLIIGREILAALSGAVDINKIIKLGKYLAISSILLFDKYVNDLGKEIHYARNICNKVRNFYIVLDHYGFSLVGCHSHCNGVV